jgi:hypothetical protein
VTNLPGYSINDVLDTDFDVLIKVVSEEKTNRKEMSLFEFIQNT